MEQTKRIIEINGIKMEIDLRQAKVIENYKVGDNVKVLLKEYSDYKSYIGTIIGFDEFQTLPTIVIAYLKVDSYSTCEIKIVTFNNETKNIELCALNKWDMPFKKSEVLKQFQVEKEKKHQEIIEIDKKVRIFEELFGKYFEMSITNSDGSSLEL